MLLISISCLKQLFCKTLYMLGSNLLPGNSMHWLLMLRLTAQKTAGVKQMAALFTGLETTQYASLSFC